ncbi:hypothetical protein [Lentzea sp. NPDC055074]
MADDNKPPNGYRLGEEGALIALDDGSYGQKSDYDTWDWKAIKSAIANLAAATEGTTVDKSERVSDPESLWDAAETFRKIKEVLIVVGDSVAEQAEAVGGEDGPWKGPAAAAVVGTMKQFAKSFYVHADQIDGGPARLTPTPEQLYSAGNYLQWAINAVNEIDYHYANEVIRIANEYNDRVWSQTMTFPDTQPVIPYIDPVLPNGMIEVSKFPKVVEAMTEDMRKVLKTVASEYETTQFDTTLATVSPPPKPEREDKPEKKEEKPEKEGGPEKYEYEPPPKDDKDGPEDDPDKYKPETYKPPPRPEVEDPTGDDTKKYTPPPKPETLGPEGDTDPTTFTPPPKPPDAEDFRTVPPRADAPPPPVLGGPEKPDLELPPGFKPPGGPGTDAPPKFVPDPPGARDPNSPPPLAPPIAPPVVPPRRPGGTTPQKPPALPGPRPPGATDPTKPGITPFDPKSPSTVPPNLGNQAPGGIPDVDAPEVEVPDPRDWQADRPDQIGTPDRRDLGGGAPMMPPLSPPAQNGQGNQERPDSSGLLDGGPKPWEGVTPPGLGDPDGISELPGDREKWAPSPVGGVLPPNLGGSPMMPPLSPPAQNGQGNQERPDSSGLLDGGPKPWESVNPPGLGDPDGISELPGDRENWAPSPVGGVLPPNLGGSPMMPPLSPPAQNGQGNQERPDSSGLLDGGPNQWESATPPGLGDPDGLVEHPGEREDWAPSPVDGVVVPAQGGLPGSPMMPPVAPPAQNGQGAQERPDSSGLLDGGPQPWQSAPVSGLGDPDGAAEPVPLRQNPSPVALNAPGVPVVALPPVGGLERQPSRRREEEAPVVVAYQQAGPGVDVGEITPPAPVEERVPVVRASGDEDFSAWDVGAAGGVLWFAGAAKRAEDEAEDEQPTHTPDHALRETTPWEHGSRHASRHIPAETGEADAPRPETGYERRAYWPPQGGGCSGLIRPEEEQEEEEQQDDEEQERRAADLLKQEDEAWSVAPRLNASGVIE